MEQPQKIRPKAKEKKKREYWYIRIIGEKKKLQHAHHILIITHLNSNFILFHFKDQISPELRCCKGFMGETLVEVSPA